MRTAVITTAHKQRLGTGDFNQRILCSLRGRDLGWVTFGADKDKIIIHYVTAMGPVPRGNKSLFCAPRMHKDRINVSRFSKANGLPRANHQKVEFQPDVFFDGRQQTVRQTRVVK